MTALLQRYGETQRRMLHMLLHAPDGASVDVLKDQLGITPGAVRQHLAGLERDGMVTRAGQQPTGGRPEALFALTAQGREAFPRRYRDLSESLIEEIAGALGPVKLEAMLKRMGAKVGQGAVDELGRKADLTQTAALMQETGYEAQVSPDNKSEIVAHNCVFHGLASRFPQVCEFDLAFLEAATGQKVEHRECMVRGGKACRFGFKRR